MLSTRMRVFASVLLGVSSAFAYQVTYPGGSQGWTTTGPNELMWNRVDTDPDTFAVVLTNVNTGIDQLMNSVVNGTLSSVTCTPPSGGWVAGSGFRVNLVQDAEHIDSILAQSSQFSITAGSPSGSTTSSESASIQTSASAPSASALTTSALTPSTPTVSAPTTSAPTVTSGVSSSDTSTTPTGVSAAFVTTVDTRASLLTAVAALAAFITTLF